MATRDGKIYDNITDEEIHPSLVCIVDEEQDLHISIGVCKTAIEMYHKKKSDD